MNNILKEEILKIYKLTYGEKLLNEDFFSKIKEKSSSTFGVKKQDIFLLQKELINAGYSLPQYGANGVLNDETKEAVKNFIKDNNIKPINTFNPILLTRLIKNTSKNISTNNLNYNSVPPELNRKTDEITIKEPFTFLNLNSNNGFKKYSDISQTYINKRQPNPLNITGVMLATAAKNSFNKYGKYLPPELVLAQLVIEGGIGNSNVNSRPIRTKNPFNVGNVDSGKNVFYNSVHDSINTYFSLMSRNYITDNTQTHKLLSNFVNNKGLRYATDPQYERKILNVAKQINNISKTII